MRRTVTIALVGLAGLVSLATAKDLVGVQPPLDPPANPTTDAKVELGRKLFSDGRLSTNGKISCSVCHVASLAFTDEQVHARGVDGRTTGRNAPTLLNVAQLPHLFWDGRAPSLEEQARQPFLNADEYGWTDEAEFLEHARTFDDYAALFEAAFGDDTITLQRMARALAAFQRTLVAGDAPFDRWWRGDEDALTEAQVRGYRVFVDEGGCAQCHSVRQSHALFTDGDFHNTGAGKGEGLTDPGRAKVTEDPADTGKFKTPTLRNVALTAPYMHDGSLATLEEVVEFYVEGGKKNPHLSDLMRPVELDEQQQADLIAFLHALTSDDWPERIELAECDALLEEGRHQDAFDAFAAELERLPGDHRPVVGLAKAALGLDDRVPLVRAEAELRRAIGALDDDGAEGGPELLHLLGQVNQALALSEDAMALARQEDALVAWKRVRESTAPRVDTALLEARLREVLQRTDDAIDDLRELGDRVDDPRLHAFRAELLYRRAWRTTEAGELTDEARADLAASQSLLDHLHAAGHELGPDGLLYRAYAPHYLGDLDAARTAYLDAAAHEPVAERALQGLRNLLAAELPRYRTLLDEFVERHPDSATGHYFRGYEQLVAGELDAAEASFRRKIDLEDVPSGAPHRYLAQIAVQRDDRAVATDHYALALTLQPNLPGLMAEFEQYVRSRELASFDDVDALVADYRRMLDAGPGTPRFQVLARNNLAFLLRDVGSTWTSRGPARVQTFPEGAPPEARRIIETSIRLYEEAVDHIPEDVLDLPFAERWVYAGVHNDLGLMRHYFKAYQDFEVAEAHYLRAFELTDGAYQDAYFYNLQFLYGFELEGKEREWLELARVAKDAILREDPDSPSGFSPDEFKRRAARRDYERLAGQFD